MSTYVSICGVGWRVGYKTRKGHVKEKEEVGKR